MARGGAVGSWDAVTSWDKDDEQEASHHEPSNEEAMGPERA